MSVRVPLHAGPADHGESFSVLLSLLESRQRCSDLCSANGNLIIPLLLRVKSTWPYLSQQT